MTSDKRILLIGFGNMGQALVRGWLAAGRPAAAIAAVDSNERARSAAAQLGIAAHESLPSGFDADVVLLAVKPNQLADVLQSCAPLAAGERVFLSIAAGKTIAQLQAALGAQTPIVRAMPNTPAAIGEGMSVLAANAAARPEQRALCGELLVAVGRVAWIDDEAQMDAVTAISGSGPAYVFLLIECLEQAGVQLGLGPELARELAAQTVAGAGAYARASDESAAQLRRRVTSPGGTTQAALAVLQSGAGLEDLIGRAAHAAAARSRELALA